MLINLRNALMAGRRLPYDAEVEYLESTGTQYIDTGIAFNSATDVIEMDYMVADPTTSTYMWTMGSLESGNSYGPSVNNSESRFTFIRTKYGAAIDTQTTTRHKLEIDSRGIVNDGVIQQGTSGTGINGTWTNYLFALHVTSSGASYFSKTRVYGYRHKRNGTLVRDYIPVRKGTVGYLYDRVSGKLFGNDGTGDFVVGQDVVPATWVDGEYWSTLGVATYMSGASRCENFIPVQPSSSVTFYLGARPGGTTLYMVQYNANKGRVNSTYNGNGSARTVTIPANCYYIRVSAETARKNEAYIHDNTNDRDLLRNGMIPID